MWIKNQNNDRIVIFVILPRADVCSLSSFSIESKLAKKFNNMKISFSFIAKYFKLKSTIQSCKMNTDISIWCCCAVDIHAMVTSSWWRKTSWKQYWLEYLGHRNNTINSNHSSGLQVFLSYNFIQFNSFPKKIHQTHPTTDFMQIVWLFSPQSRWPRPRLSP